MRARIILAVAITLAIGGCATGTTPQPSPATSPSPSVSPEPSASPSGAAASPSVAFVTAKVTFDGRTCTYAGPTSVPDGTPMHFEYDTTVDAALVVGGVDATFPTEVLGVSSAHASNPPAWFDTLHYNALVGSGTTELTATNDARRIVTGEVIAQPRSTDTGVFVGCSTPPDEDDLMYGGAVIWIVPG